MSGEKSKIRADKKLLFKKILKESGLARANQPQTR